MLLNDCLVVFAVVYFPASGYRSEFLGALDTGMFIGVRCWTSSTFGRGSVRASSLVSTDSSCHLFEDVYRSVARSVRCVQELAVVSYIIDKKVILNSEYCRIVVLQ